MQARKTAALYEQWQKVVAQKGAQIALRELGSGQEWTFQGLDGLARAAAPAPPLLHTTQTGLGLIVDVLRAWREGSVLLPDDSGSQFAPRAEPWPGEVCHLKITSGSGGERKMAMFVARQLIADAGQIIESMGLHDEQPNLATISMAHSYGFSSLVLPLLLHGIPLWLLDHPLPETLRRALEKAPVVCTLPAVPALWRAWHHAEVDFHKVALGISAGAPLPVTLEAAEFQRSGFKIHNFYGSTECGGIAYDATPLPRTDPTLAGTPLKGVHTSLHDGCLRVHSPATGIGYSGDATPWEPGIYQTQDYALLNDHGAVHLLGRAGETISIAGYKVAPETVEAAFQQLPGVKHCLVFGVPSPDPVRHEEIVVCLHHDADVSLADLRTSLPNLPSACLPRHWWSCPDLHPDARGKYSRPAWRQRWLTEQASPKNSAQTSE